MQTGPYPEVPPDFGHWLAGFIDGEGCFYIQRWTAAVEGYTPVFAVTLRDDDRPTLEAIVTATGLGVVKQAQGSRTPRSNPTVVWRVWRKGDCARLSEILAAYPLRSKKARDADYWMQAVRVWREPRATRDWTLVREIRTALTEGRRYDGAVLPRPERPDPPARLFP